MAVRSIIDIEVNDSDFQRYAAAFSQYQEELKSQPGIWSKVSEGASSTAKAAAEMGTAVGAAFFALHKISTEHAQTSRETQRQASAWSSMASSAGKFASRVGEATRSLLRWGELTGLISGILGGGGLYGIDRLAIDAGNQRRQALGLGATIGEAGAAQVDLARLVEPNAFMGNINKGINDVTSPQYLAMMNVGAHPERQTDAATAAFDTIQALKKKVDQIPEGPLFGTTAHAFKYDELMSLDELRRLRHTPEAEVNSYVAQGRADAKNLNIPDGTAKVWQDLQVQFERVSATLKRDFIVRLTELAPAFDRLSGSFLHLAEIVLNNPHMEAWIDDIAGAINRFAAYLDGPDVKSDVEWFMGKMDDIYQAIKRVVGEIPAIVAGFESAIGTIKAFWDDPLGKIKEGGVNGPLTDDNPNAPGSPAFERKRHPENYNEDGTPKEDNSPSWLRQQWYRLNASPDTNPDTHKEAYQKLENDNNLPEGLLNRVEKQESGFKDVLSPAGAQGYFQFMPATAGRYDVNPHDEMSSATGAAHYLRDLLKEFHGDVNKALAAYNAGEGRVESDVKQYGDRWREHIPDETKNYVNSIAGPDRQASAQPKFVPNQGRPSSVAINVNNQTGGNSYISASQLAVG